jgi:hypothetical protein
LFNQIYSGFFNGLLSSLTEREAGLYISEAIYRLTLCVTHASALLNHAHAEIEGGAAPKLLPRLSDLDRRSKKAYVFEAASHAENIRRTARKQEQNNRGYE